ncbi:hypothetical protein [Streptomyces hokutonensis]|uniref:hypothetical protein n=1 Tax=Streptomyces hokutonensis TaxID=1306990 RepID=UPI00035D09DD|nr:hypothetical protein [Streptomyces hokutonensis]
MPQNPIAVPLAPMTPAAVTRAFTYLQYVRALQTGDTDTAPEFGDYAQLRRALLDVADRIVTPITALPSSDEGGPSSDSFALEALGRIFLSVLHTEDDVRPSSAVGIAAAIISFTEEILTENPEDVTDTLEQLRAAALEQARGARPAPGARTTAS